MKEKILLPVFYLPPVSWFARFLEDDTAVVFEQFESLPKQTYRNRANIYGANGRLALSVPIKRGHGRTVKDIQIAEAEPWRDIHWKSIKTAYQSSPYFEFYEDRLASIFNNKENNLLKFNLAALEVVQSILKTEKSYALNTEYFKNPEQENLRDAFSAKEESRIAMPEYYQVFNAKHGFLKDLSVVDIICNLGPESLSYIKNINKNINNE